MNVKDPIIYTLNKDYKPTPVKEEETVPNNETEKDTEPVEDNTDASEIPETPVDSEDKEEVVEEDYPYEIKLQNLAKQYGLTKADFQQRIIQLSFKYGVSLEQITFGQQLTFVSNGKTVTYDIVGNKEISS